MTQRLALLAMVLFGTPVSALRSAPPVERLAIAPLFLPASTKGRPTVEDSEPLRDPTLEVDRALNDRKRGSFLPAVPFSFGNSRDSLSHTRWPAKTWLRFTFRRLKQMRPQWFVPRPVRCSRQCGRVHPGRYRFHSKGTIEKNGAANNPFTAPDAQRWRIATDKRREVARRSPST